jgi:hypothetical protein
MVVTPHYVKSLLTAAVLLMVAIVSWRLSGPAATLLGDLHLHLVASMPHPAKVPAPKMTSIPKLAPISCRP